LEFHDIVGAVGVALVIGMYLLLQTGRIAATNLHFSLWNAVGSVLILISLFYQFNLSAVLIEGFWLAISLYGLARTMRSARDPT
jgi:paired small multidrug resistance pump